MVGSGAALLSVLLPWLGASELEAGANLEVRGGQAPTGIAAGQPVPTEQGQLMLSATPLVGARWTGGKNELRALSATRMLWRPMPYGDQRPIFLETLDATHVARPTRRTRWQLELRSTYGEEDYISLLQLYANQPQLPRALTMFTASALGDGTWQASRRTTLTLLASGIYRRALSNLPGLTAATGTLASLPALPTQTLGLVRPGLRYALDRRTRLELRVGLGDTDLEGVQFPNATSEHLNILMLQPEVGLVRDLTRTARLRVFVGLTYAAVLANPDPRVDWHPLTPLFRGDLSSLLWRTRASTLRAQLGGEASWYVDPVLGLAVWRGTTFANLEAQLGPRWDASVRASFITDLSGPLDTTLTGGYPVDETVVQLDIPIRYRWSSRLAIEFGGRYAERAPHLASPGFAWRNRELWAFLALTGTTHRTRSTPPPAPRSGTAPPS